MDLEAHRGEPVAQQVALGREPVPETGEIAVGQLEPDRHGRLEGRAGHEGQELLGEPYGLDEVRRTRDPADLPPGEGERLACGADRQRPLAHPGQRGQGDVGPVVVERHVLVDLVGDHDEVVLDRHLGDRGQLLARQDRACRVVR